MPSAPSRWQVPTNGSGDDPDVFPILAGAGFAGLKTPLWSTDVKLAVSGVERRRALWSYPVWKFKLSYEFLRDSATALELQRLWTFFNQHSGGFQGWFYYDAYDHTVTSQNIGTGNGSNKDFQLTRTTTVGSITFTEPVRGVYGTPTVTVNGTPTGAYTIGANGLLSLTSAPGAGQAVVWTGSFFFLCRFLNDELNTAQMMNGLFSSSGLDFQTYKS